MTAPTGRRQIHHQVIHFSQLFILQVFTGMPNQFGPFSTWPIPSLIPRVDYQRPVRSAVFNPVASIRAGTEVRAPSPP